MQMPRLPAIRPERESPETNVPPPLTWRGYIAHLGNKSQVLADIDSDLMLMYEAHLHNRGLTKNSTSFYMRILRAVYNRAVEKDLTTNRNPFKHVYTGNRQDHKASNSIKGYQAD